MNRFCELVTSCEHALQRSHYNKEVLMFWYGVLTEAIQHINVCEMEQMPDVTWETYEAICDMATRAINNIHWYK